MPCSPTKGCTRLARGMNPPMPGHHPPVKHRKPPVRLCHLCPADSPGPIYGLTPFRLLSLRSVTLQTPHPHSGRPTSSEIGETLEEMRRRYEQSGDNLQST